LTENTAKTRIVVGLTYFLSERQALSNEERSDTMSATARDYAYIVKEKADAPPVPVINDDKLEAIKAEVAKYPSVDSDGK